MRAMKLIVVLMLFYSYDVRDFYDNINTCENETTAYQCDCQTFLKCLGLWFSLSTVQESNLTLMLRELIPCEDFAHLTS